MREQNFGNEEPETTRQMQFGIGLAIMKRSPLPIFFLFVPGAIVMLRIGSEGTLTAEPVINLSSRPIG